MQGPIALVGHGVGDDAVVDTQAARKEAKKELKRMKKEQKKAKKIQEVGPCLPVRLHCSASSSRTICRLWSLEKKKQSGSIPPFPSLVAHAAGSAGCR